MFKAFQKHISEQLPILKHSPILLAISGGVDSMVLAQLCKRAGLQFAMAHCNFKLRGAESDGDAAFVEELAATLDVEVFVQEFDTEAYAKMHKVSTQMAARTLRYQWFEALCEHLNYEVILTAHHADDHLETMLINWMRGTGMEGLMGIPEVNEKIMRPLLPFSRDQIMHYAKDQDLVWREDSSNSTTKYVRNQLRHEVIPKLKEMTPQLLQNFQKTVRYLKDSQSIIDAQLQDVAKRVLKVSQDVVYLDVSQLKALHNPKAYLYELLKDYGFTEWNDVADLLDAQSGKQVFSEHWRLIKDRDQLLLVEKLAKEFEPIKITEALESVQLPEGMLTFERVTAVDSSQNNAVFINSDALAFPLCIRPKAKGDYFFPMGMKGKKKLSKYFKDEKMSLLDKERSLVLTSEAAIVWVIGRRLDQRFKVSKNCSNILKISIN